MYNSKPKKRGCRGTKKKHGNPKIAAGCSCKDPWSVRETTKERVRGKRLCQIWHKAASLEDVEV